MDKDMAPAPDRSAGAGSRTVIAGAACAAFMNILDRTIVSVSLPSIVRDLEVDTSRGVYVLLAHSIMLAGTVLMFGKMADRRGVKPVMSLGFLLFTFSSLLCSLAPSLPVLVAGRFLQGVGGGVLAATSLGAVGYYLPPDRRGWGIGIISAASALGAMLGAPLGGILSESLGWRWIFIVNIPVGLAAWWLAAFQFPRHPVETSAEGGSALDMIGVFLSILALSALILAITRKPGTGWASPWVLGGFFLSGALFIAFIIRERRLQDPLLDLDLFKDRRFLAANLANVFTSMLVAGMLFLLPFYFIFVKGLSPSATGAVLLLFSGVYVLISPLAGRLSDRIGVRLLTTGGMGLAFLALFVFLLLPGGSALALIIALLTLLGVAYGMYLSPNNRQILSLAPADRQGSASGIVRLFFYLGQLLGVAMVESVLRAGLPAANLSVSGWGRLDQADLVTAFQGGFAVCCVLAALSAACSFYSGKDQR
jgi:EmrB/QacA subfamily drug resistance transporter